MHIGNMYGARKLFLIFRFMKYNEYKLKYILFIYIIYLFINYLFN